MIFFYYCCCVVITAITVLSTDRGHTFTYVLMATTSAYEHAYINVSAEHVHLGVLGMVIPNSLFGCQATILVFKSCCSSIFSFIYAFFQRNKITFLLSTKLTCRNSLSVTIRPRNSIPNKYRNFGIDIDR